VLQCDKIKITKTLHTYCEQAGRRGKDSEREERKEENQKLIK
jgi:hypothetical protein